MTIKGLIDTRRVTRPNATPKNAERITHMTEFVKTLDSKLLKNTTDTTT